MNKSSENNVMGKFSFIKRYKNFKLSIDGEVKQGVTAVFGNSGSGKTSLLNCISGLTQPEQGYLQLNGETLFSTKSPRININPERRRIGYVLQDSLLFPHLSVLDNIKYGFRLIDHERRLIDPDDLITIMGLTEIMDRKVTELSGGEARRVSIARALAISPNLLMLDEPMQGLDFGVRGSILRYLKQLKTELNIPIILVSHSISEVVALAQHVIIIDKGNKVIEGSVSEILSNKGLNQLINFSELENVFEGTVKDNGQVKGVVTVLVNQLEIEVPFFKAETGCNATVSIKASDIIIATSYPEGLSARNILKGTVKQIVNAGWTSVVYVDAGIRLIAEITTASLSELDIKINSDIYLIIKANSITVAAIS